MDNKIILGDCLERMKDIPDKSVDMILCDLPYGTTNCSWDVIIPFELLWKQYKRIIKENGAIVLFGTEPFSSNLRLSNLDWFKYDWIWSKSHPTGFLNAKKQPLRSHEIISVFYKNQPTYNFIKTTGHIRKTATKRNDKTEVYGKQNKVSKYDSTERYPRSIQYFSSDKQISSLHPTQKPLELCKYLIKTYTNKGELVLDNCIGSGTTAAACLQINRNFIGIELQKKYVDIANKRIGLKSI